MEYLILLIASVSLWWFFFEVTDRRLSAHRKAGRLLLRLRYRNPRGWITGSLVLGVGSILLGLFLVAFEPRSSLISQVSQTFLYLVLFPFNSAVAARALARGVELREQGIVRNSQNHLRFSPWSDVLYCRWLNPPGTLFIQCRYHNETHKVSPAKIPEANAVLTQHVTVREAQESDAGMEPPPPTEMTPADASQAEEESKPELVGFQFTLRMLLVFMLSASAFSSWFGIKVRQYRQQQQAIAPLTQFQPRIAYRGVCVVGVEFVTLQAKRPTDADLAHLPELEQLETLDLSNAPITDRGLIHIKRLRGLKSLNLCGTQVTAAGIRDLMEALPDTGIAWLPNAGKPRGQQK